MMRLVNRPIFWGVVASGIVVLFGVWIGVQEICSNAENCQPKYSAFVSARPNEIGDTLAGFAGSLAFIWIIVTVWLQSQELAEQRAELRLTRLEMKEQREATQDMARSLSAQAKIFEDEARQRDETRAKELFDELIKEVCKFVSEHNSPLWKYVYDRQDGSKTSGQLSFDFYFAQGTSHERRVDLWVDNCIETVEGIISDCNKGNVQVFPNGNGYVLGMLRILDRMLEVRERLSEAQKIRFDALSIEDATRALHSVLDEKYWGSRL